MSRLTGVAKLKHLLAKENMPPDLPLSLAHRVVVGALGMFTLFGTGVLLVLGVQRCRAFYNRRFQQIAEGQTQETKGEKSQ